MWSLVLASALGILGAGLYAAIGMRYAQHARTSPPQAYFALFWFGLAAYGMLDSIWGAAVPLLDPSLSVGLVVLHLKILAGTSAFFGLVYYIAFVYTGRSRLFWPILAFYVLVLTVTIYSYAARDPIGQEVATWGSGLKYAHAGGTVSNFAYALLFGPPVISAVAYGALVRHATSTTQRLRILATSSALAFFFAGVLLNWVTNLMPSWPLFEKVFAIVAALVVFATHPRAAPASAVPASLSA